MKFNIIGISWDGEFSNNVPSKFSDDMWDISGT